MPPETDVEFPNVDIDGMCNFLPSQDLEFAVLFGSYARGDSDSSSDVDVAIWFPAGADSHERFRRRNRIDAELQAYADAFVDVSDIESLPEPVASNALRDGVRPVGETAAIDEHRARIEANYDPEADDRERRAFIDRLARGDV
jgi:predicted nucleotidyltransferase